MYKHILVPTDGSALSAHAIDEALALAKALDAKVTLFTVIEPFHLSSYVPAQIMETRELYEQHAAAEAERRLEQGAEKARALGVAHETVSASSEDPHEAIIEAATAQRCDLIAMASHGRRGVKALVLGSMTSKVLTHSQIPVLVYRHAAG
ncbi:universal stress protein [Stutzerimonas kirkiae]|uniref:Universal stress protein n=1 Tax=Stutzerimonas kirkiae TaxID=2211392 RepID=A0A4V2KD92_9GAMM|nr:universal stress protein [Stutzerimonas kirkiae]TBU97935.1 universal stress protein [Stutzerimonas kirkiae]TBV04549.1 universal stress protein [Stutzerimonas kirkiae]TBV11585.1 universal stress protein [Stutzerimonas kirkiae]TBV16113.1 universal stress protein [Stutzerimonas kirkiae]